MSQMLCLAEENMVSVLGALGGLWEQWTGTSACLYGTTVQSRKKFPSSWMNFLAGTPSSRLMQPRVLLQGPVCTTIYLTVGDS